MQVGFITYCSFAHKPPKKLKEKKISNLSHEIRTHFSLSNGLKSIVSHTICINLINISISVYSHQQYPNAQAQHHHHQSPTVQSCNPTVIICRLIISWITLRWCIGFRCIGYLVFGFGFGF